MVNDSHDVNVGETFPHLISFSWQGRGPNAFLLLLSRMRTLQRVSLADIYDNAPDIRALAPLLEQSWQSLQVVSVDAGSPGPFPRVALKSLTRCRNMMLFSLIAARGVVWGFSQEQMRVLALPWPALEAIIIDAYSWMLFPVSRVLLRLDVYSYFAADCPQICHIDIRTQLDSASTVSMLPYQRIPNKVDSKQEVIIGVHRLFWS
ncbi:hypothetical protein CALCODRAFT_357707 [Calocera cornea HHB12733]|uniref:F-box domain-containing protein n=1 Tax=Calocera cornea HHB12733 TaxID=1353952 RepID=A0A165EPE3_9BASI|nr:hypothetical protein CALCODRAFT_357707 [Calocera cornea HHB12733]